MKVFGFDYVVHYEIYDYEEKGVNFRTRVSEPNQCVDPFPLAV
jgi:hypothetical protein